MHVLSHLCRQSFDFLSVRVEMGHKVFQLREHISRAPYMVDEYMGQLHNLLLPSNLHPMVEAYVASAHDNLLSMISSMDGASGALKTFIISPAYRSACYAGFGPDFPADKSYPFFKAFDDDFHLLGAGLPKFLLSKPLKAWDQLLDVFESFVKQQNEKGEDLNEFLVAGLDGYRRGEWVSVIQSLGYPSFNAFFSRLTATPRLSSLVSCGLSKRTLSSPPTGSSPFFSSSQKGLTQLLRKLTMLDVSGRLPIHRHPWAQRSSQRSQRARNRSRF